MLLKVGPSTLVVSAVVVVAGALTAAVLAGIEAGTITVLVLAGLIYAVMWEGGTRIGGAFQRRIQRRRNDSMSRQLRALLVLTLGAFALVEGIRLVTGQEWSWVWAIGFGVVIFIQLVALVSEQNSD